MIQRYLKHLILGLMITSSILIIWKTGERQSIAAELKLEKTVVSAGFGSTAGSFASLWVAESKGFFKQYGLDVKVIYARGVIGAQAMVAGDLDFLYGACTEMMTARKGGMDIVVLVATSESNIYTIASRPGITDPKQLVGKRVAVNTLGDTSHLSARFALKQAGVDPNSVTYVQVGNTPARLAALQSGAVEAALQSAQNVGIVKNLGMNILINLFEQRIPYCASALGVSKSFLRTNPQTVEAFVRGLIKGNAFIREGNPDGVKAIMGKYMKLPVTDKRLVDAYNFYATQYNLKHPGLTRQGVVFIIEQMAMRDKTWLEWKPEQFYDTSVIDRLKREGLLEQVYKEIR